MAADLYAQFTPNLVKKDFEIGERIIQVTSNVNKKTGRVLSWDSKTKLLRIDSPDVFKENDRIRADIKDNCEKRKIYHQ